MAGSGELQPRFSSGFVGDRPTTMAAVPTEVAAAQPWLRWQWGLGEVDGGRAERLAGRLVAAARPLDGGDEGQEVGGRWRQVG